jgi:hypothetical protein
MSDPFLDGIESALENGEVPQKVTNRMVLAALRIMNDKVDEHGKACEKRAKRITALELWQSRANGAITAAMALGGAGLAITVLKLLDVL